MNHSFLSIVTSDLIRRVGLRSLGDYTLVFPMQRAGLFVRGYLMDAFAASGDTTPVALPSFTTIDMLADSLCPLRSDDEVSSVFRLYQAYCAHARHEIPVDAFYGWGLQLMTDLSNVDMALLDIESMMHYTAAAGRLGEVELDEDARLRLEAILGNRGSEDSVRRFFTDLWSVLPDIYRDFHAAESAAGVGTRGERTHWVIEHAEDPSVRSVLSRHHYVFVGFNYLLAAERQLMTIIRDGDPEHTLFYWDYDAEFPIRENGIFDFMQPEIARFGNALPDQPAYPKPQMEAVAFGSESGQAEYVHRWLLSHHHPGEQTAIVVADESLLPQVVYSLPEDPSLGRINITKGYPLRSSNLYGEMLGILRRHAEDGTSPEELIRTISSELETFYRAQPELQEGTWLRVLTDESYYQLQLSLRQLLQLIQRDTSVAQNFVNNNPLLLSLIRRRMELITIPFHGEPLTDIQIIGVLETRLLDFDNILILSVEEGIVPSTPADRSFLPFDLRKECHISTREEDCKIYGYNFFRLLRRARHVTMAFSEATTETGKRSMSRFLMQILTHPAYSVTRLAVKESNERQTAVGTDAVMEQGQTPPARLSPSAISDYIECPKEFYLKHICGIQDAGDESVVLSQATIGSLVHGTLESLCLQRSAGTPLDYDVALRTAYDEVNRNYLKHHHGAEAPYVLVDHEGENYAIREMARAVMTEEEDKTKYARIESPWLEHEVCLSFEEGGISVLLHGFIDRLDLITTPDGERYVRILDYKTGGYNSAKMKVEKLEDLFSHDKGPEKKYVLQTLIYSMLYSHQSDAPDTSLPIRPELFFVRKPGEDRKLQIARTPLTDYRTIASEFEPKLREEMKTILSATTFEMADEKICCASTCYCPFHLLCNREKSDFDF